MLCIGYVSIKTCVYFLRVSMLRWLPRYQVKQMSLRGEIYNQDYHICGILLNELVFLNISSNSAKCVGKFSFMTKFLQAKSLHGGKMRSDCELLDLT